MKRTVRTAFLLLVCIQHEDLSAQPFYEVLVNSRGTNSVIRYDADGNYLNQFVSAGDGGLLGPEDILFHPDGTVLVTGFGNAAIKRYDGVTGAYIGDFSTGYALTQPSKMSIGPDDLIYVTQWGSSPMPVVRFDPDGGFVDEFTSAGVSNGLGHFWDDTGRFYISEYGNGGNGVVRRFAADGTDMGVFIDSAVLQGPTGLWRDANGDVLVQDWTTGNVLRYSSEGVHLGVFVGGLSNPEGMAVLPDGDLLMGDWGVDGVHRIAADGTYVDLFVTGLSDPNAVRVREVAVGIAEAAAARPALHVVPNIGPGPFELRMDQPPGVDAGIMVYDALGHLTAEFPWPRGAKAVPFRMPDRPKKPCGRYVVMVRSEATTSQATLTVVE